MKIPIENFNLFLDKLDTTNLMLSQISNKETNKVSDVETLKRLADVEIKVSKIYQLLLTQSIATGKEKLTEKGKEVASRLWYQGNQKD